MTEEESVADRKGRCPDCYLPPAECLGHEDDDGTVVSDPMGVIIIEWPAPTGHPLPGWGLAIFDAATGAQIKTCVDIHLHCDAVGVITADLRLFADAGGKPIFDGEPVDDGGGEVRTGVFLFDVTEMRVRPA